MDDEDDGNGLLDASVRVPSTRDRSIDAAVDDKRLLLLTRCRFFDPVLLLLLPPIIVIGESNSETKFGFDLRAYRLIYSGLISLFFYFFLYADIIIR